MKMDPGSNYLMISGLAPASVATGDHETGHVDHAEAASASFLVDVGDVGSAGTVDAVVQYSDDGSTWTNEPDGLAGNNTAIEQMTAVGQARVDAVFLVEVGVELLVLLFGFVVAPEPHTSDHCTLIVKKHAPGLE